MQDNKNSNKSQLGLLFVAALCLLSINIGNAQQNLIYNGDFEHASETSPNFDGQADFLNNWETRVRRIDANGNDTIDYLLHSPDWKKEGVTFLTDHPPASVGAYAGAGYVGMSNYELIQQKWNNANISENQGLVLSMYIYLSENSLIYEWDDSRIKVILSKNQMRYVSENDENEICTSDYVTYDNNSSNYEVVGELDVDLSSFPHSNGWVRVSFPFKAPFNVSQYDWIAIELARDNFNGGQPSECSDGYIWIDNVELLRADYCYSKCAPNLGSITHTTLPNAMIANGPSSQSFSMLVENAIGIDFWLHSVQQYNNPFYYQWAFDPDGLKDVGYSDYYFSWIGEDANGNMFPEDAYAYTMHIWNCSQDLWYDFMPLTYLVGPYNNTQGYDIQDFELESCCPPFAVFTGVSWSTTFREDVEDYIICDGATEVQSNGDVTLAAENQIDLLPGFTVHPGGELDAFLQNCIYGTKSARIPRERHPIDEDIISGTLSQTPLIYPNPSSDGQFSVMVPEGDNITINVYNALSQKVMVVSSSDRNIPLNLSAYEKGIYFVEIELIGSDSVGNDNSLRTWKERIIIQ